VNALFNNVGHFFATAVSHILFVVKGMPSAVEKVADAADTANAAVQKEAPLVEAVTAAIPTYGPAAVPIEKAAVMVLGAVCGVIHTLGEAAAQKFADLGLDQTAIQTAVDVYQKIPGDVKALVN